MSLGSGVAHSILRSSSMTGIFMDEPCPPASTRADWDEPFVSAVGGILEQFCLPDVQSLAEAVLLNLNHPLWAVWLPAAGRGWVAARPAGSRPPSPEMQLLWVDAESAVDLSARMLRADAALLPPS
jgi:hypothetical protein